LTPDLLTLDIEKPAAGGRMLARHDGQIVLVLGAIPGERVRARIERAGKGILFADTVEVVTASPDRRDAPDLRCGGSVLAHVAYPRQLQLKSEIIQDAFARIGRLPLGAPPPVIGSPEHGYRMRARLHARGSRLGFFREGTHDLCDAAATRQLSDATHAWIASVEQLLRDENLHGLAGVEVAENMSGDQRACHLELRGGVEASAFAKLSAAGPLTGLSAARADQGGIEVLAGEPGVTDMLGTLALRRDARAFFQGNRFLLERLVREVQQLVPAGPVVDLYAGVGLFGLSLAAAGATDVTLVEGDPISGADLQRNADPVRDRVRVLRSSVETFVASRAPLPAGATFVVDPPRTGMSKEALAGIIRRRPARMVYVSCDVATLARDTRTLLDAGYELGPLTGIDLFPNTAHVETLCVFDLAGA
jgi:23S rRNA (uracil1939-C5)-methyltransferase